MSWNKKSAESRYAMLTRGSVETRSGAHPASSLIHGTFPAGTEAQHEAVHYNVLPMSGMDGAYLFASCTSSWPAQFYILP
jgi:hypothetical protein